MNDINRTEINRGVFLSCIEDDRFKKQKLFLALVSPLKRETVTDTALLPYMLSRGINSCPDMTQLARRLAMLYGADISRAATKDGNSRVICVALEAPNALLLPDKSAASQYVKLLEESVFGVYMPGGSFDPQWLDIEKEKLRESIRAVYNDKREYNLNCTSRAFYGEDDLRSLDNCGYEEDLANINSRRLTDIYHEFVDRARIEILCIGPKCDPEQFAAIPARTPERPAVVKPVEKRDTPIVVRTPDEVVQQNLAMLFSYGELLTEQQKDVARLANLMFGGSPTSRLFSNVREKQSLCYYCSSSANYTEGTVGVVSGIEKGNEEKLTRAVMNELESLQNGSFTDKELAENKLFLENMLTGVNDSVQQLGQWYLSQLLREENMTTPQQLIERVNSVSGDQVSKLLSMLKLNTVGFFTERN